MSQSKKGSVDLLNGPILRSMLIFMIPILISSAFQQLYNAVDTAIVGNVLGEHSLAAIGACSSVFELFVGFAGSLASGFSIVTARAFGSGDKNLMKKAVAGALEIGFATTVIMTLAAIFGLRPLLQLINTPAEVFDESLQYIMIIGTWISVMFAYNFFSGLLRAIGNSVMPLVFLVISSLLNIVLDYTLIAIFHLGVAGAAIATVIAQGVSVVLCIIYIMTKTKELIPERTHFKWDGSLMKDLAGQGYAMAAMGSIVSVGTIILQSGINSLGTEIIAGHIAARKIYALFNLPFISMSIALSTFISQNKGAGKGDRILKAMKISYTFDVIAAAVTSVLLFVLAPFFIKLISGSDNPVILSNGTKMLYIVGPFYAVLGILLQTRFALQGIGAKLIPLVSSVIEFVGKILFVRFFIPRFGYNAVVWCEPLIWVFMTAHLLYAFNTNSYIKQVRKEEKISFS